MDMTLGTPPKTAARAQNRDPFTRMAESAMLRQLFVKAQEYQRNKTTNATLPRDLGMEALGRMLRREIPARIQANNATDIRAALRLAEEQHSLSVTDETIAALRAEVGDAATVELSLLAGLYEAVARMLQAFAIEVEEGQTRYPSVRE
jgi:imidazolonepropionase-like amidohydrolase